MKPADKSLIFEQIIRIIDGAVSEEEFRSFEKRLLENPEVLNIYLSVLKTHAYIQKPGHPFKVNMVSEQKYKQVKC